MKQQHQPGVKVANPEASEYEYLYFCVRMQEKDKEKEAERKCYFGERQVENQSLNCHN